MKKSWTSNQFAIRQVTGPGRFPRPFVLEFWGEPDLGYNPAMRFSLRTLLLVMTLIGPGIWLLHPQVNAYRDAIAARDAAELRWQEWKSASNPTTTRMKYGERHARLRYARDRQVAAEKASRVLIPITLPPQP